jgi:hypothetical protein
VYLSTPLLLLLLSPAGPHGISLRVDNVTLGFDPLPGVGKSLIVLTDPGHGEFVVHTAAEGSMLALPRQHSVALALYGCAADVSHIMRDLVLGGGVSLRASNDVLGDPVVGHRKTLVAVMGRDCGAAHTETAAEGDILRINAQEHSGHGHGRGHAGLGGGLFGFYGVLTVCTPKIRSLGACRRIHLQLLRAILNTNAAPQQAVATLNTHAYILCFPRHAVRAPSVLCI